MSLTIQCPECGHAFRLPEKFAGRRGKCPQCAHVFRAPTVEEEIADWGEVAEEAGGAPEVVEVQPIDEWPTPQVATGPGKPKIPLPKRLSEVTPPPAPGAGEELPDLAALSVPGGPPPAGPPVATRVDPEADLPDLSSISEAASSTAQRGRHAAKPATPIIQLPGAASPVAPAAPPTDSSSLPDLSSLSVDAGGPAGRGVDTGSKRKRRSSDTFDASELVAHLGQTGAAPAQSPQPSGTPQVGPPPESSPRPKSPTPLPAAKTPLPAKTKSAAPAPKPKAAAPAPQPKAPAPASKPAPKPSAGPAAKSPKLPTAKPLTAPTAESSAKAPAKPEPQVAGAAKDDAAGFPGLNLQPKITGRPKSQAPLPAVKQTKANAGAATGAAAAPIAVVTDGSDKAVRTATSAGSTQPRKKPWMLIGVGGALVGLLVCVVAAWAISSAFRSGDEELTRIEPEAGQSPGSPARDEEGVAAARDAEGATAAPAVTLAEISALKWDESKDAVVLIEVLTDQRKELGTGFLIEPRGWVATAYSLIHHGRHASIVTADGRKLAVKGTVAKDPDLDLAILQIEDPGDRVSLITLPLDEDLERLDKKTAYIFNDRFRSQADTSRCTALQSIPIAELRASLRPFITEAARENGLLNWIELDGNVSGTAHGGPVIDADGKVIGVAEYMGTLGHQGYAIHVKHLRDLKQQAGPVQPLVPDPLARLDVEDRPGSVAELTDEDRRLLSPAVEDSADANGGDTVVRLDPTRPGADDGSAREPQPPADDDPFAEPKEITAAKLEEALAACDELRFIPVKEDYVKFQDLAFLLTEVQRSADNEDTPADQRQKQKEAAEKVVTRLSRERWVDVENINKFAVDSLANPHRGTFFYAMVVGAKPNVPQLDGLTGVFLQVIDTDKLVVFPTKLDAAEFPPRSRWLIVGIHNPSPAAPLGVEINGVPHVPEHVDPMFVVGEPVAE